MVGDILQPTHLLFILAVALLVLGPKRLPEVGRALGRGLRDFRSAISGEETPERTIQGPESSPTHAESSPSADASPVAPESAPTEVKTSSESAEPVASAASTEPRP